MQLNDIPTSERISQRKRILAHLQAGEELTSVSMLEKFGAYDGRKRISELRKQGYPIKDRPGHSSTSSARFNIYYMDSNEL